MSRTARQWLDEIHSLDLPERVKIMNVCGGHERAITMAVEGVPSNLLVLLSGRLTWPAVAMLLDSSSPGFDALIAPGHVATVMASREWQFVSEKHAIPSAVAGFSPASLMVSDEGACRIWWAGGVHDNRHDGEAQGRVARSA